MALSLAHDLTQHLARQARHLNAYNEFNTFRSPAKRSAPARSAGRIEALDDLHRTLYGSLHPSAAIQESDRELVEEGEDGEGNSSSASTWLENNALTAALGAVAVFALYSWLQQKKTPPLHGPADVPPTPPSTP